MPTIGAEWDVLSTEWWGAAIDADINVFLVDASRGLRYWIHFAIVTGKLDENWAKVEGRDGRMPVHCLFVLNKMDTTLPPVRLLTTADFFKTHIKHFTQNFCAEILDT